MHDEQTAGTPQDAAAEFSAMPQELAPAIEQDAARAALEARMLRGANWYFWIAGLSIVNSFIHLADGDRTFIVGLGVTQIVDGIALEVVKQAPGSALVVKVIAIVLSCLVSGVFVAIGFGARHRLAWVSVLGIVFYALDGLLFLAFGEMLCFGFHIFALIWIVNGLMACRELARADAALTEPLA